MIFIEELASVSWRCVRFVPEGALWPDDALVQSHELRVAEIDGRAIATQRDVFDAVSDAFLFPDYFGFNWDSLEECLRDLEWVPAKGYVLRVRGSTELWQRSSAVAGALVESWLVAAEHWAEDEVSFVLVFGM